MTWEQASAAVRNEYKAVVRKMRYKSLTEAFMEYPFSEWHQESAFGLYRRGIR